MTRTFIQLAVVTTALAVVGPALAAPRSVASSSPMAAPTSEPTPAAAQAAGLCGITQQDVTDIVEHYDLTPDMQGVADMLAVPFDCSAYGNLCAAVGAQNAQVYACETWGNFRDHRSVAYIKNVAHQQLTSWAEPCSPDLEACQDICDPDGVLLCDGIAIGGNCQQLAICDDPRLRPLFAFRHLVLQDVGLLL